MLGGAQERDSFKQSLFFSFSFSRLEWERFTMVVHKRAFPGRGRSGDASVIWHWGQCPVRRMWLAGSGRCTLAFCPTTCSHHYLTCASSYFICLYSHAIRYPHCYFPFFSFLFLLFFSSPSNTEIWKLVLKSPPHTAGLSLNHSLSFS